jgi:hypothetical protein
MNEEAQPSFIHQSSFRIHHFFFLTFPRPSFSIIT